MANGKQADVFDVGKIKELVELMNDNGISEIDLSQGEARIQLRRTCAVGNPVTTAVAMPAPVAVTQPAVDAVVATAPAEESRLVTINSPMVGTFYTSSNPDAEPFVKVGDSVGPDSTVCIIEAMKVFNEIQAELSGRIVAVLAQNGDSVDFGRPLFKVDPQA
ncbi:MAG: acetyl-CoA carboxylase biotin carboxyl carrier protein [Planctomycetia bacterium]|nr:acetyl-CoA carboxylase biotin carboxyl carrier protein [Planctomycetia bacterium]